MRMSEREDVKKVEVNSIWNISNYLDHTWLLTDNVLTLKFGVCYVFITLGLILIFWYIQMA